MVQFFWTMTQSSQIQDFFETACIPVKVQEHIVSTLYIMDGNYGTGREIDSDGGYIAILIPDKETKVETEYEKLLTKYHMTTDWREFHDIICETDQWIYYSDMYIVNSEYVLMIIVCEKKGDVQ